MKDVNTSLIELLKTGLCPRCGQGRIFHFPFWKLWRFSKMNKKCSHCSLSFEPEPGFYFGAMYISYTITVMVILITGLILYYFFDDPSTLVYILSSTLFLILIFPFNFRLSRLLFFYLFGAIR